MSDLTRIPSWTTLAAHKTQLEKTHLRELFAQDAKRFENLSFKAGGILVDFSKNKITNETLHLLAELARERNFEKARTRFFAGEKINTTENRAVMHTALRMPKDSGNPDVHKVIDRMTAFAAAMRCGQFRGHTGKEFTDIVNIGIGGSYLGPEAVCEALKGFHHPRLRVHFVSNVEASQLHHTLQHLSPETTLFLVASKTFTTAETMMNAKIARERLVKHFNDEKAVEKHFVALSTNEEEVKKFGIPLSHMFPFWDWVGGRYSVWSSIGLPVMLMVGPEKFREFLAGAHEIDEHFKNAPLHENIPALMGLIGVWHRNFLEYPSYACIPYHSGLRRLPAWLQQLDMESNGKHALVKTGPAIFGEPGTDAQHSFFQWLHQGTDVTPVDFIAAVKTPFGNKEQQHTLLANCLAQSQALMAGRENKAEPHRHFEGDRPSTTFLLDELNAHTLGALMAMYEHKVFTQGVIWGINSFDQWGVELGKVMAQTLVKDIASSSALQHDASTNGLIEHIRKSHP